MPSLHLWRQAEQLKVAAIDTTKSSNEIWIRRQSLQEIYRTLLITDLEFSLDKKVEQELWNHAFKKQITSLQNQSKEKHCQKRGEIQASLNLFLDAASGFYIQLLEEVCSAFHLDLPFRASVKKYGMLNECPSLATKMKQPRKSSCFYLCQDCLVHLGDIARYRQSYDQAQSFYKHAAHLVPYNGQPYNQLAILEAQKGNRLSTVFYHARSLMVKHPFPVAETNITKFYAKISKEGQDSRQKLTNNEWVTMFLQFLSSIHLQLDPMKSRIRLDRIILSFKSSLASSTFTDLQLLQMVSILFYEIRALTEKKHGNTEKESSVLVSGGGGGGGDRNPIEEDEDDDEFMEEDGKGKKRGSLLAGVQLSQKEAEEVYCKRLNLLYELAGTMLESIFVATNEREGDSRKLLLPAVKVYLDWMVSNKEVVNHPLIAKSGLWSSLCCLANNFIRELERSGMDSDFVTKFKAMPLPEDRELQYFLPILKQNSRVDHFAKFSEITGEREINLRISRILDNCRLISEMSKNSGLLVAKYSDSTKLLSFHTSIAKTKFVMSDVTTMVPVSSEKKQARLNVAMQKSKTSSDPCDSGSGVSSLISGNGDGGESSVADSRQAPKRSLKVEFKETVVERIWKEGDSDVPRNVTAGDDNHAGLISENSNNNGGRGNQYRQPMQAFQNLPFPSFLPTPNPYAPFRPPMYPCFPLPPPHPFRPGYPLPAPPVISNRFLPPVTITVTCASSNSANSSARARGSSPKKTQREAVKKVPFNLEEEFPSLPSKNISSANQTVPKDESPDQAGDPSSPCAASSVSKTILLKESNADSRQGKDLQQTSGSLSSQDCKPKSPQVQPLATAVVPPSQFPGEFMPSKYPLPLLPPEMNHRFATSTMPNMYAPYPPSAYQQQPALQRLPQFPFPPQQQERWQYPSQHQPQLNQDQLRSQQMQPDLQEQIQHQELQLKQLQQQHQQELQKLKLLQQQQQQRLHLNNQPTVNREPIFPLNPGTVTNYSSEGNESRSLHDHQTRRFGDAGGMDFVSVPHYQQAENCQPSYGVPVPHVAKLPHVNSETFYSQKNVQQHQIHDGSLLTQNRSQCSSFPQPNSADFDWSGAQQHGQGFPKPDMTDVCQVGQQAKSRGIFQGPKTLNELEACRYPTRDQKDNVASYALFGESPWTSALASSSQKDHCSDSARMPMSALGMAYNGAGASNQMGMVFNGARPPNNQMAPGSPFEIRPNNSSNVNLYQQSNNWPGQPSALEKLLQQQRYNKPTGGNHC